MSYCPKCGNKVDETMTFCPRCGASLKGETTTQPGPSTQPYGYYRYRYERHEKPEKQEKGREKNEKGGGGFGFLVGGLVVVLLGVLAYINAVYHTFNGPIYGALFLVIIGIIIVVTGVYYGTRARRRNPVPT